MDPDRLIQWRPQQWRSIYSPNKPVGEREVGCCMQPIYLYVWDINRKKTPPHHLCCFSLWLDADESTWHAIYLFVFLADKCLSACVCLPVCLPVHICNVMLWRSMWGGSLFDSLRRKVRVKGQHPRSWYCSHEPVSIWLMDITTAALLVNTLMNHTEKETTAVLVSMELNFQACYTWRQSVTSEQVTAVDKQHNDIRFDT